MFNAERGRFDRADEISGDLFRIARELDAPEIMLQAHHSAWPTASLRGLFRQASEHIDAGLPLYHRERHAHHRYVYLGHDPAVCGLASGAFVQWALGYPVHAQRFADAAITLARDLQHAPSLAQALSLVCEVQVQADSAAATTLPNELLKLSEENGLRQYQAIAQVFLGWIATRCGEAAEGIVRLENGVRVLTEMGRRLRMTSYLCITAESYLLTRRFVEGLQEVDRALRLASETGERFYVSRLYQVHAELLLHAHGSTDESAEASLRCALAAAREQSAKGWELRAATSLARLWLNRRKRREARDVLAPVYDWFTEGFDTPDLKEAKALLNELA